MKIALTMRTHDRTIGFGDHIAPNTKRNYLGETLQNMLRAGVLEAPSLTAFIVNGDAGDTTDFFVANIPTEVLVSPKFWVVASATVRLTSNLNAAQALEMGAHTREPADWVLFCEDDLDVCDDFIEGVAAWLERFQRENVRLYTFGSTASDPEAPHDMGLQSIPSFYGTTCYAMRRDDARSMAAYVRVNPLYDAGSCKDGGVSVCHDLHFHQWHAKFYPEVKHIGFSNPSFVQHIGVESGISTRTHEITYKSWPGRAWRYRG
jgi:hypothetical protein